MNEMLSQEKSTSKKRKSKKSSSTTVDKKITDLVRGVGSTSMAQAAVALSSILNKQVSIKNPKIKHIKFKEALAELNEPKVSAVFKFKEGLKGNNLFLLNVSDAVIIADLMVDGDGHPDDQEFTEMELSAVSEAMNQMIGSVSTSIATMIDKKVDIFPPEVNLWENGELLNFDGIAQEADVSLVLFDLIVDGVIESQLIQVFTEEMVNEISESITQEASEMLEKTMTTNEDISEKKERTRKQRTRKVTIHKPEFDNLTNGKIESSIDNLDLLMDVPLDFSVVLGNSRKSIKEILSLGVGSVVELDRLTDEPLEIYVNSKLIAQGEVVVINENFGIRITSILSKKQRINHLN